MAYVFPSSSAASPTDLNAATCMEKYVWRKTSWPRANLARMCFACGRDWLAECRRGRRSTMRRAMNEFVIMPRFAGAFRRHMRKPPHCSTNRKPCMRLTFSSLARPSECVTHYPCTVREEKPFRVHFALEHEPARVMAQPNALVINTIRHETRTSNHSPLARASFEQSR